MALQSFITARELTAEQIRHLVSLSLKIKKDPTPYSSLLKGKTVVHFFIENSTRSKTSFEVATRKLGGASMSFVPGTSSLSKGETLLDTAMTLKQYGADLVVMRHPSSGAPKWIRDVTGLPIVNSGDGTNEHPSQALLDAVTLVEHWGGSVEKTKGKKVLILGDIAHSRVARSNIHLLTKLGIEVTLCAPRTLLPVDLTLFPKVNVIYRLDDSTGKEVLAATDAVICLRVQSERQNAKMNLPSLQEFRHFWGMTVEREKLLKKDAVVLHPGPVNRGVELDSEVADSKRSLILKQVENGVWARMALLATILAPEGART